MSVAPPVEKIPPPYSRRRLIARITAILLLVTAALVYRHYWHARPIGSGPAGPAVSQSLFADIWSERPVLLVGIGDSVTAGFGASTGHGYFDRLVTNPADEFPDMQGISLSRVLPNLTVKNLALSGSTSIECLERIVPKLEIQDPRTFGIVTITTGGNDIIHNYGRTPPREGAMYGATYNEARPWIGNFSERLFAIVDRIETKFPGGCRIFIANIYDPTDDVGDAFNAGLPPWRDGVDVIEAYNQTIESVAKHRPNVELIDAHRTFLGHGIHCLQFWRPHYDASDPHYWYYDNLEDPNDRGYDALRRLFLNEMARVLPAALRG
jgi:lysophospholipase L1-like esterase